jgi:hypothetical protein
VREHIKILGILNMVMGGLTALAGIAVLLILGGIAGVITALIHGSSPSDADNGLIVAPIVAFVGVCIAVFLLLLSAPSLIGGWGLLHFKPWSRLLMIVVSGFHLLHVPLGTALGVYGLWVLVSDESRALLENHGMLASPVQSYPERRTF